MVVVVADHGINFVPGQSARRVTPGNIADIARVPLFSKAPMQKASKVDLRAARTIDVVPTIADVLDVQVPWKIDGRSLLAAGEEPTKVMVRKRDGGLVTSSHDEVDRVMIATIRRKTAIFGAGRDSLYEFGALGSARRLVGLSLRDLPVVDSDAARVQLHGASGYTNVDVSTFVPARVIGDITGIEIRPGREIAIAINGRIGTFGRSYRLDGQRFSALVPPTAFRNGFNRVDVLLIDSVEAKPGLIRLLVSNQGRV